MAMIRESRIVMRTVKETQYTPAGEEPKTCQICGEPIYRYDTEKYGSSKEGCFGSKCIKPYKLGMIRGDIYTFSVKEYDLQGHPTVHYPKADGYSTELRASIKALLESWGFEKITFKEPGENSNDRHTFICGTHRSSSVNIAYKSAPKTDRILCFNNKYGVVTLTTKHLNKGEPSSNYNKWFRVVDAIELSLKRQGIKPYYLGNMKKVIVLPNRELLREKSEKGIIQSKKDNVLSAIWSHQYKIKDYRSRIKDEQKNIADLEASYLKAFGEAAPEQKVNC